MLYFNVAKVNNFVSFKLIRDLALSDLVRCHKEFDNNNAYCSRSSTYEAQEERT